MKIINKILAVTLIAVSFSAASEVKVPCEKFAILAETIMKARQTGVTLRKILSISESKSHIAIIKYAYRKPRYHSESKRNGSIVDFSNEVLLLCLDERSKHKQPAPSLETT